MAYLLARDTINGTEGSVIVTVDGKNKVIAGMKNITIESELQSNDMRAIGTRIVQGKNSTAKLTGKGNIYYGDDVFRDMALQYINTGVMPEFGIQLTNNDPTTSVGTQTYAVYGCTLTGTIPLAILNDEEAMLNYDFNFTYTKISKLQSFTAPTQLGG